MALKRHITIGAREFENGAKIKIQVQTLIDELKQTQRMSPTHMIINQPNESIESEIFWLINHYDS